MINRAQLKQVIHNKLESNRVVALVGPSQRNETALARGFVPPSSVNYFDLEDLLSLRRLDQPLTPIQDCLD